MSSREFVDVELRKNNPTDPWGFRLQGGYDFNIPVSVQRIIPGGVAENCGLRESDTVLSINGKQTESLTHEEAKREIINCGNYIHLQIERSTITTWKPHVQQLHTNSDLLEENQLAQETSLKRDTPQTFTAIGSSHNRSAKPFGGFGSEQTALVNKQYNSPMGIYSTDNVSTAANATLNAHAADLISDSPDCTKSNNHNNNDEKLHIPNTTTTTNTTTGRKLSSHVYDALNATEPIVSNKPRQSLTFSKLERELENPGSGQSFTGFRRVQAPTTKPVAPNQNQQNSSTCKVCDRLILGVFVKVRGSPMHAECFKCKRCGKNLKNEGYFVVNDNLYCENDAKIVSNPGSDMIANAVYR